MYLVTESMHINKRHLKFTGSLSIFIWLWIWLPRQLVTACIAVPVIFQIFQTEAFLAL